MVFQLVNVFPLGSSKDGDHVMFCGDKGVGTMESPCSLDTGKREQTQQETFCNEGMRRFI